MNIITSNMSMIIKCSFVFGIIILGCFMLSNSIRFLKPNNKKYLTIILILLGLSFGSFFLIRSRSYHCIYKYLEMHNITKNEIIEVNKRWYLLTLSSGDFGLDCKIKGRPQNNIYALFCNGIDNKVKVSINYLNGDFKKNVNLNEE